jgi:uracil-DNA glycosylase
VSPVSPTPSSSRKRKGTDWNVGFGHPLARDVYAWSRYTPLDRIRVVIIGQDPYHNIGQAHGEITRHSSDVPNPRPSHSLRPCPPQQSGLCFSVQPGVTIPGSLRNIYTEIKSSYPTEFSQPPKHGHLLPWARSGVLLLNTSLTVRAHKAGSHSNKGWETFTDRVVELVDLYGGAGLGGDKVSTGGVGAGVVFLAWGAWAAKRVAKLDKKKHLILTSAVSLPLKPSPTVTLLSRSGLELKRLTRPRRYSQHPSPLSAHRGFLGNGHFKKANEWLEEKYGETGPVEWWKLDLETAVS